MLVYGRDEDVAHWVAEHIPHVAGGDFGLCVAIGVASQRRLIAGVVYHDWMPAHQTIQLSIAAINPMWARAENIRALLAYPFGIGVFKVWTLVSIENHRALRLNRRVGFKHEATLAHQFGPGKHADMACLLKPDFEQIYGVPEHGQISAIVSPAAPAPACPGDAPAG